MPKQRKEDNPKSSENLSIKYKENDVSFESLNTHDQKAIVTKLELHAAKLYKEHRKESNFLRKNLKRHTVSNSGGVPRLPGINKLNQKMTDYLNHILSTKDYEVDFSKVSKQGKKKSAPLSSTALSEKKIGKTKLQDERRPTLKRERAGSRLESETTSTVATQSVLVNNPATLFHVNPRSKRAAASMALAKIETMQINGFV